MEFVKSELEKCIKNLTKAKVLVVGDLALDEMVYGDTERISREAPVLILRHSYTKYILGGASNAANNASKINDGKVSVVGIVGNDYHASDLIGEFNRANINCEYLVTDDTRETITKTRISGSCSQSVTQQIVRIDRQTSAPLSKETEEKLFLSLERAIPLHDMIILSDYHVGSLSQNVINKTIELANKYNKMIVVDAQRDLNNYKGITSLTPNLPDTQKYVGFYIKTDEDFIKAAKKLLKDTEASSVVITCGSDGMVVYNNDILTKIPVFKKSKVFDVTGAGDTVTAVYSLALATGSTPEYAAFIGNMAASIVIKQFGCATTSIKELLDTMKYVQEDCYV